MVSAPSVRMGINIEELYQLIGERETIKFKQAQEIGKLYEQIGEMSAEITKLREENKKLTEELNNGRLVKSTPDDSIRRFPVGVQGEGRGCGDDVSECADRPSNRISQDGSSGGGESQTPGV